MSGQVIDPITLEVLARAHQRQVLETYLIYGQCEGTDQPEHFDRLPLSGLRDYAGRLFEMLAIVLVVFLVVGLSITGGTTP